MSLSVSCPQCLGMTYFTACGEYTGPDIAGLGIRTGMSLDDVISKLAGSGFVSSFAQDKQMTTDDILTNVTNIGTGSVSNCVLNISKRDFAYTLGPSKSSTVFTYDFTEIIDALPAKYGVGRIEVTATGTSENGISTIASMKSPSSGFSLDLKRYPINIDVLLRLTTPCGNVDMRTSFNLISSAEQGTFRRFLDVKDLTTNSASKTSSLSNQLTNMEYALMVLDRKVNLQTVDDVKTQTLLNGKSISELEQAITNPGNFSIEYFDSISKSDNLTNIINSLFTKIQELEATIQQQNITISSLESLVDSLNSIA